MNDIKNADFLLTFPEVLKEDETMLALGKLMAEELHITAESAEKNVIYADIDKLAETWLDILAYDLHVEWYNYDYPVETKRKIIKSCVKIHQKSGTKYAVETALQDVYKTAKVEEWFEYGGEPYTFRVHIIIENGGLTEEADREIVRNMQFYKNVRSHCAGICYRLGVSAGTVKTGAVQKVGGSIKVKPYLVKSIRADTAEGSLRAYLKNENIITIRKER